MTADHQVLCVNPSKTPALTVFKPGGAVRAAMTQGAWPCSARSLLMPTLMQGVEQWLPDETITCMGQSPSSGLGPGASVGSRHSLAGPAGVAAGGKAVHKMPGSSLTSSSLLSEADSEHAAGAAALPLLPSSSHSVKHTAAVAGSLYSSNLPAAHEAVQRAQLPQLDNSIEAAPKKAAMVHSTLTTGIKHALSLPRMPEEDAEPGSRCVGASDVGHLLSSSSGLQGFSPAAKPPPRRDDSAIEHTGVTGWIALSQHKAAVVAAAVNRGASGLVVQTSDMLQQWSDSQLSAKTTVAEK